MIDLPPLGLGTAPLGNLFHDVTDADSDATVAAALDAGIGYFDTAPRYGDGAAETRLGRALPADRAVVSTKAGWRLRPGGGADPDWTERGIRQSLEGSLDRLGRSHADILYLHDPDDFPAEIRATAHPAARRLREEGLVRAIGFGMNHSAPLARYVEEYEPDAVLIAGRLSLLDHDAITELLPACLRTGTAVVVGGVFNTGLLAAPGPDAMFHYRPAPPEAVARAERCRAICAEFGVPLPAAAIRFPFLHPAVRSVVVGCRSAAEATANAAAFRTPVPDALWERLAAEGFVPRALLDG